MNKKLSCFLCWLPLVLLFGTCIPLMVVMFRLELGLVDADSSLGIFMIFFVGAILAVIAVYGVMIWLIINVCKRQDLTGGMKAVWAVCLYMFNVFAFPVYWFKYIRYE